ncbi:MAG TPA: hypothetical protein VNN07_11565 [Candidatus Tectomicrobia bacterium]|nr:hypothetical protein [Candidatus Tectomicrobia bacterium]
MKTMLCTLLILAVSALPARAAGPVERTFDASADRVWATTQAVLEHLGWEIDKADRAIGFITTESRRLDGENYGVYEKGVRHRLRLHVKAVGPNRTTVSVERTVFKRERILFVDQDEPLAVTDRNVEKALLDQIARAL